MVRFTTARIEHHRFPGILRLFAADLREETSKSVIVVHRPAIERMVVTLRALQTHAHEDLGHVLRHLQRLALNLIVVGGWIGKRAAITGQNFLHDFVDRHIVSNFVLQPVEVEQRVLVTNLIGSVGADLKQFSPLHHPHFNELFTVEQLVHQLVAFIPAASARKAVRASSVGSWPTMSM